MAENRNMDGDASSAPLAPKDPAQRKPLSPAAQRALAEAEARRKAAEADPHPMATRYGDWENKGIASDF